MNLVENPQHKNGNRVKKRKDHDPFLDAQENLIQWGLPFAVLFKSRFVMFYVSFLLSHYMVTYRQLVRAHRILDVGCGLGLPVRCLQRLGLSSKVIGVDVYAKYLRKVKKIGIYEDCVLATVKYLPFKSNFFDSVMCLQVLEHLSKKEGKLALDELSRVADTVVVTTPVGFVEADSDSANAFQAHKSGWYPQDLRNFGYTVKGYGGVRIKKLSRLAPLMIFNVVLAPLLTYAPRFAYHMYAVKTLS